MPESYWLHKLNKQASDGIIGVAKDFVKDVGAGGIINQGKRVFESFGHQFDPEIRNLYQHSEAVPGYFDSFLGSRHGWYGEQGGYEASSAPKPNRASAYTFGSKSYTPVNVGQLAAAGSEELPERWSNLLEERRKKLELANAGEPQQAFISLLSSDDPETSKALSGLNRTFAVNNAGRALLRNRAIKNKRKIADEVLRTNFEGRRITQLTSDERTKFNALLDRAVASRAKEPELDVLAAVHNIGVEEAGDPNAHIDVAFNRGRQTAAQDLAAASRVMAATKAGILPNQHDLERMQAINASPARKELLVRAQMVPGASSGSSGSVPSIDLVREATNRQLGRASTALKNYGMLQQFQGIKENPIWWFIKTLFTDPRRFYRAVNFFNSKEGGEFVPTGYKGYLPWLNLVNNLAGSIYNPSGSEFKYWG